MSRGMTKAAARRMAKEAAADDPVGDAAAAAVQQKPANIIDVLRAQRRGAMNQVINALDQLNEMEARAFEAEFRVAELKAELESISAELKAALERGEGAETQLAELRAERSELIHTIFELRSRLPDEVKPQEAEAAA